MKISELTKPVRMVLDTDTANEIDDQFALAYALLSPEAMTVEAVYAAPFGRPRAAGPEEGMLASYDEILRVLDLLPVRPFGGVFKGSRRYLDVDRAPLESEARDELIERARSGTEPLVVAAIGAATNVASALLAAPDIAERVIVVWLGANAPWMPSPREFNFSNDPVAGQILFESPATLVWIPALGVASHLLITAAALDADLGSVNPLGAYLAKIVRAHDPDHFGFAKEIWDISAIAHIIEPKWVPTKLVPAPTVNANQEWGEPDPSHQVELAYWVARNAVFGDMCRKFAAIKAC
ncbi:MAG: nucleoside hydrolase [Fimbriimonadaceae bacterium]